MHLWHLETERCCARALSLVQVVERSPWMNPNHPDWVAYLFHKVYTLLPKRPPAPGKALCTLRSQARDTTSQT